MNSKCPECPKCGARMVWKTSPIFWGCPKCGDRMSPASGQAQMRMQEHLRALRVAERQALLNAERQAKLAAAWVLRDVDPVVGALQSIALSEVDKLFADPVPGKSLEQDK